MASNLSDATGERTKYGRMCCIVVELNRDMLWELLISQIPASELKRNIDQNRIRLTTEQLKPFNKPNGDLPSNSDLDTTVLYKLLRHLCPDSSKPTHGWAKTPDEHDIEIGDDIERIRITRNDLYAHIKTARLDAHTYEQSLADIQGVAARFDRRLTKEFTKELHNIKTRPMDQEAVEKISKLLEEIRLQDEEILKRIEENEGKTVACLELQSLLSNRVESFEKKWSALEEKNKEHIEKVKVIEKWWSENEGNVQTLRDDLETLSIKVKSQWQPREQVNSAEQVTIHDAVILYAETEGSLARKKAIELKDILTKISPPSADIKMLDELGLGGLQELKARGEAVIKKCRYIFVLMTPDFHEDRRIEFTSGMLLTHFIDFCQDRLVPIWIDTCKKGYPMCLASIRGLKYHLWLSEDQESRKLFCSSFEGLINNGRKIILI